MIHLQTGLYTKSGKGLTPCGVLADPNDVSVKLELVSCESCMAHGVAGKMAPEGITIRMGQFGSARMDVLMGFEVVRPELAVRLT